MRYRAFCDELRLRLQRLPNHLDMEFMLPMPDSWSEKKKQSMVGQPHRQKPDLDNIVKAVFDAMLEDDSVIADFRARKVWGRKGGIFFHDRISGA